MASRMQFSRRAGALSSLVAGLVCAILMQTATGWWMYSGRRVAINDAVFFVLALAVSSFGIRRLRVRLIATWLGVQIGLTIVLFGWLGGSNIWPIVIVIGGIVSGG